MAHIRHAGLVVHDIDRATYFYTNVFGFTVLAEAIEEGAYIESLLQLKGAKIQWCKLSNAENTVLLELIKYHSHPSIVTKSAVYQHGCSHVAVTVTDIDETLRKLRLLGGAAAAPVFNPEKTVRVVYARDPEGILLELVQNL